MSMEKNHEDNVGLPPAAEKSITEFSVRVSPRHTFASHEGVLLGRWSTDWEEWNDAIEGAFYNPSRHSTYYYVDVAVTSPHVTDADKCRISIIGDPVDEDGTTTRVLYYRRDFETFAEALAAFTMKCGLPSAVPKFALGVFRDPLFRKLLRIEAGPDFYPFHNYSTHKTCEWFWHAQLDMADEFNRPSGDKSLPLQPPIDQPPLTTGEQQ